MTEVVSDPRLGLYYPVVGNIANIYTLYFSLLKYFGKNNLKQSRLNEHEKAVPASIYLWNTQGANQQKANNVRLCYSKHKHE